MTSHVNKCIKTCQREKVNTLLHFSHAKRRVTNFWTALFCNFTRGWEFRKGPKFAVNQN